VTGEFAVGCGKVPDPGNPPEPKPVQPWSVLPFTGAQGVLAMVGAALGVLAAGLLLLAAARRRREDQESAPEQ
jgi:LPXTG-motif cell wall-anchored protein